MNIQGVIMVASGPPGARGIQGTGVADLEAGLTSPGRATF